MPEEYRTIAKPLPTFSAHDLARFWSYIPVRPVEGCWLWTGATLRSGYGLFTVGPMDARFYILAHRLAYYVYYGCDPGNLFVCHTCDTPACCFGAHLFPGTPQDNINDAMRKGRLAQGDAHWLRQHPEWITWRGENHPLRRHPERYVNLAKSRAHPGIAHGQAKLSEQDVREIRQLYAVGDVSQRELAKRYGVNQSTLWKILHRKNWTHI